MLTPHPLTLKLKLPNFNNKTLSEANASLFFIHKVSVLGGALMSF